MGIDSWRDSKALPEKHPDELEADVDVVTSMGDVAIPQLGTGFGFADATVRHLMHRCQHE